MASITIDTALDIEPSGGLSRLRIVRRLAALWRLQRRVSGRQGALRQARSEMLNNARMLDDVGIDARPQRHFDRWFEGFVRHQV